MTVFEELLSSEQPTSVANTITQAIDARPNNNEIRLTTGFFPVDIQTTSADGLFF
ncbi:MAG: hypothetical protein ACJAZ0_000924 [Halioglobus sp.]|jgi:hypothetical protein